MFGGHSLWEYISVLFDNIPKIMYLIYTAIASCLDLIQCVMRKLAGLDTYWVNGQAYTQQDPILEFILGMLGLGRNAETYSPLSIVFWSFVVFGVIVLALSTMVAIIKSHYNEDAGKTNPLTHIYTAIKSIFTLAIVPVAIILGIYISQFLLQTMDNITTADVEVDTLRGIYGETAAGHFVADDGVYTRYDFFGFGPKSSSQTISGILFRTAAYDANRVRRGTYLVDDIKNNNSSGNIVFGDTTGASAKPANVSDKEWIAYQIDYAFVNNLYLDGGIWAEQLYYSDYALSNTLLSIASCDFFRLVDVSPGFSKYNVGLVWYYYYLWNFNFFVGFASIIVCMGLLTGIIIGLMSRLIFGAALFLIYPPTLGLAPLDDWKSFKEWRKKFVAQILMAFGSIIGMNLFFLILPYVNEFDWFGTSGLGAFSQSQILSLPNLIVNTLVIIVGLLTIKSFVAFVSGLIGADDALATGDNMKKDLTSTLAKTGGAVLGTANIATKIGNPVFNATMRNAFAKDAQFQVRRLDNQIHDAKLQKGRADSAVKKAEMDNDSIAASYMEMDPNAATTPASYKAAFRQFEVSAKAQGVFQGTDEYNARKAEFIDNYLSNNNATYKANKETIADKGYKAAHLTDAEIQQVEDLPALKTKRQQVIEQNYLNDKGEYDKSTAKQIGRQMRKEAWGAILKGLNEGTQDVTGINIKGVGKVFQRATNLKYNDKGEATGTYTDTLSNENYRAGKIPSTGQTVRAGLGNLFSASGGPPPVKPDDSDKRLERSAENLNKVADALLKATENLRRFRPGK